MMTQRGHLPGTCWLARLLRGLRPDRNPLRRGSDRAESVLLAALLAAFLAGAPFVALAAGHWASAPAVHEAQAQRASLSQVTATLVRKAPIWSGYGSGTGAVTLARWRAPDGHARTGEVFVTAGTLAGGTVRVWVDHTGQLANPPLTGDQRSARIQLAAGTAVAGLAVVLATAGWLTRRSLDRRRLAGWDAEWLANGPRWSPRRLGPNGRAAGSSSSPCISPPGAVSAPNYLAWGWPRRWRPVHLAAGVLLSVAWVAFKVGALSYGGGFVIIPLMQSDAVSHYHWMTGAQFLNAVALGRITPGPVVQTVAVVGYAPVVAFSRSFAFVLLGAPGSTRSAATATRGPPSTAPGPPPSAPSSAPPSRWPRRLPMTGHTPSWPPH